MTIRDSCRNGSYTARLPTLKLKAMLPYLKGQFRHSFSTAEAFRGVVDHSVLRQVSGREQPKSMANRGLRA